MSLYFTLVREYERTLKITITAENKKTLEVGMISLGH